MSELLEVRLKISSVEKDINDAKKDANDAKNDGNTQLFLLLQQQLASLQQQMVLLLQKEERMDATAGEICSGTHSHPTSSMLGVVCGHIHPRAPAPRPPLLPTYIHPTLP